MGKKGAGRRERRIKSHVKVNNDRKEEKRQIDVQKEMWREERKEERRDVKARKNKEWKRKGKGKATN